MLETPLSNESDYQLYLYEKLKKHVQSSAVEKTFLKSYFPSVLDIYTLGLTIVVGGQYFGWNFGLDTGFLGAFFHLIIIGTGYTMLVFCNAEITSAMPFAGGAYGLARITLGEYIGFMVGMSEALEYTIYVACSAATLSDMIFHIIEFDEKMFHIIILFDFLFFVISLLIMTFAGKYYWKFSTIIGLLSTFVLILYFFGALAHVNFSRYAMNSLHKGFEGSFSLWMERLPLAAWWFVGIEAVSFSADEIKDPKKTLPVAMLSCVLTLFSTAFLVLFSSCSYPPGTEVLASEAFPLTYLFADMFNTSLGYANILALPAIFATAFGFMYPVGKLLSSMAMSNLLPSVLQTMTYDGVPYVCLLLASTVSFAITVFLHFYPLFFAWFFNLCMLFASCAYISQAVGYLRLQDKFSSVDRGYKSPFGKVGSYLCIFAFTMCIISILGFQEDYTVVGAFITVHFSFSIYYFTIAESSQKLSLEEERAHLALLIIKYKKEIEYRKNIMGAYHERSRSSNSSNSKNDSSRPESSSLQLSYEDSSPTDIPLGELQIRNPVISSHSGGDQ